MERESLKEIRQRVDWTLARADNEIEEKFAQKEHLEKIRLDLTAHIEAEEELPPEKPPVEEPDPDPEEQPPEEEEPTEPEPPVELKPPHVYVQPADPKPPHNGYPENRPDGFETELALDGSTKFFDDHADDWFYGAKWIADHRVRVVEDPASKYGHAVEKRWYEGDDSGWQGMASLNGDHIRPYREVYMRKVFALSDNFQSHGAGEKIIISTCGVGVYTAVGDPLTLGIVFGRFMAPSGEMTPAYAAWLPIRADAPDVSHMKPNELQASEWVPKLERGHYNTIEVHRRTASSPDPAVRDGFIRFLWNGVEYNRFSMRQPHMPELTHDVSLANVHGLSDPRTFPGSAIQLTTYWGGANDRKRVDDYERMSEFVWAGKDPV